MLLMWKCYYKPELDAIKPGFNIKNFLTCNACQNIFGKELGKLKMSTVENNKSFSTDPKDQFFMIPPVPCGSDTIKNFIVSSKYLNALNIETNTYLLYVVNDKINEFTVELLENSAAEIKKGYETLMLKYNVD